MFWRKAVSTAVLALILCFAVVRSSPSLADIPNKIVEWAESNVVQVYAGSAFGTGWFISPTRLITACHVTTPLVNVYISKEGSMKRYPAKVIACNYGDDIALLELTESIPDSKRTVIKKDIPKTGQTTYGAGYPTALPLIITEGVWQRRATSQFGNSYIDFGHALPGDSGSPILVLEGGEVKVVSLREAVLNLSGQRFENITFVVAPQKLWRFLDENN